MQMIREHYNEKSPDYERGLANLYFKIYDAITWKYTEPYIPTNPQALVLDAAGGTGRWSIPIARKGCRVVLLDVSEGMLAQAQKRINEEKLQDRITVTKDSILSLDFPEETFDLVFCDHALFLFPDPSKTVRALTRVLKKKSVMVISAQSKYSLAMTYLPDYPKKANGLISGNYHHRLGEMQVYTLTPKEFKDILEANRLSVEKIVGKVITMPLRIPPEIYLKKKYPDNFYDEILQIELCLCEDPHVLGLAGHFQAIARKS